MSDEQEPPTLEIIGVYSLTSDAEDCKRFDHGLLCEGGYPAITSLLIATALEFVDPRASRGG